MEKDTNQEVVDQVTATNPEEPIVKKPNNKTKIWLWGLGILAAGAIIATAIFAYLYFTGQKTEEEPQTDPTTSEIDQAEPIDDEVEITDTYILRDLDEKIAILHDATETGPIINKGTVVGGYSGSIFSMYTDGHINPPSRQVAHVINSLKNQIRYLDMDEREAVIAEIPEEHREGIQGIMLEGIDGDIVAQKYKDVFGQELVREDDYGCYVYRYNKTHDFYYRDPVGGCGGTSPYKTFHYKNRYTTSGDKAYVYVSVALSDGELGKVYCDIADLILGDDSWQNNAKVCAALPENGEFVLDKTNYQDFAEYRFVFNKADNGTYYFERVEKV